MTTDEILALARKSISEGWKIVPGKTINHKTKECCILSAACIQVEEKYGKYVSICQSWGLLKISPSFVKGLIFGFDNFYVNNLGLSNNLLPNRSDEYITGIFFGEACRKEFLGESSNV